MLSRMTPTSIYYPYTIERHPVLLDTVGASSLSNCKDISQCYILVVRSNS
jgi:hypothetical protein